MSHDHVTIFYTRITPFRLVLSKVSQTCKASLTNANIRTCIGALRLTEDKTRPKNAVENRGGITNSRSALGDILFPACESLESPFGNLRDRGE